MGREGRVMELNYKNVNGYLLPELEYKSGEQMLHIGKYGFLRRVGQHLLEIDRAAKEREEIILKQLEKSDPLPDKEADQMAWVRAINQHRVIAEEMILAELIYVL